MDTDVLLLEDINQLRDNVYRARRKMLPSLPTDIIEVYDYLLGMIIKEHFKKQKVRMGSLKFEDVDFTSHSRENFRK